MQEHRQKDVPPRPYTQSRGVRQGRTVGLALLNALLVIGLLVGCAGVTSPTKSTNPTPASQTHKISGTIAPAADGTGATVTLSGAATGAVAADGSGNFVFTGLAAGTYVVTPSKSGFNFSPGTQTVTLTTADATAVDFSAATIQARSAVLTWTASTTPVAGYDIYRSTTDGGPYILLNSTPVMDLTYTDTTVQSGQTYFYVTTAVDSTGTQSVYSNQVQAVIP
jgi:hypothetical protein